MASGSTTISSLPYPLTTDPPNVSSDVQALATALDGKAIATSGLLSGRPSSGLKIGQRYYATDAKVFYMSDGTGWFTELVAGPWTNMTLASGAVSLAPTTYAPQARIVGDEVHLRGAVQPPTLSANGTLVTMPSGMHPANVSGSLPIQQYVNSTPAVLNVGALVQTSGDLIVLVPIGAGGTISFDSQSFSLV